MSDQTNPVRVFLTVVDDVELWTTTRRNPNSIEYRLAGRYSDPELIERLLKDKASLQGVSSSVYSDDIQDAIDALEAKDQRIAELSAALKDMFSLIDEGFLCRDISRDAEPGWAIEQLGFVQRLAANNKAISEDSIKEEQPRTMCNKHGWYDIGPCNYCASEDTRKEAPE